MRCIIIWCSMFVIQCLPAQDVHQFLRQKDTDLSSMRKNISSALNNVLHIYENKYSRESVQYADALQWVARKCMEAGDNRQAKHLAEESDVLFRKYGSGQFQGRDTVQEIFRLDLLTDLEYLAKRDYYAIRYCKEASSLKKSYFGQHSETYLNSLLDLSRLYAERLKHRKSNDYHNMGYSAYVERIRQEFCSSSESERIRYWEKAIKYINRTLEIAHSSSKKSHHGGNLSLASAAYNAMLLSKGLLLNTTIGFDDYVNQSGNQTAISYLRLKKQLADEQADQSVLDSLDYQILQALKENGQTFSLPHLNICWQDVAEKMSPNDLAIEFYRVPNGDYGALLLKKGWPSPRMVRLPNIVHAGKKYLSLSNAMDSISLEHYTPEKSYALWHLSKSVWTDDIIRFFPEKNQGRVFFAADGELLITGIEYLPFVKPEEDGNFYCVSDLFDIHRLSSTRQLVTHMADNHQGDMAIYGGLDYSMGTSQLMADAKKYRPQSNADLAFKPRAMRGALVGLEELDGTINEVESIAKVARMENHRPLHVESYIGQKGTEASFKALSGKKERIIHIATHGFFYNENDSTFNYFALGNDPMVRSGLFFAGADNKWFGDEIPKGVDDGFLTALEISTLDFRGLELITLSACETGKGSIKGDGVFGLQRGFKMAGAQSILMSLWKVDDNATCMLMSEFYKNWIGEGKTKHDALLAAQKVVRSHKEKGWDAPKYWAAFILLDATD